MSVCIGNISRGQLTVPHVTGLVAALSDGAATAAKYETCLYLDAGRNAVVARFLTETDCDWLLFIDSDIGFYPDQIRDLVDGVDPAATPVIGGLYENPTSDGHIKPVAYREQPAELTDHRGVVHPWIEHVNIDLPDIDAEDMVVDAVGTGFMAIHRSLLEEMADQWAFPHEWFACELQDGTLLGEDLAFCRRVRSLGYPIILRPTVRLAHMKDVLLTPHITTEKV